MRFTVESWDPAFGSPVEGSVDETLPPSVDLAVEVPASQWAAISPPASRAVSRLLFVDGVRRIDARVWLEDGSGDVALGICASYAAGGVVCAEDARLAGSEIERGLFAPHPAAGIRTWAGAYQPKATGGGGVPDLINALREGLRNLEVKAARRAQGADLVIVDGPLTRHDQLTAAVGYIKSHRVDYLPEELRKLVSGLLPGQRTPLFVTQTTWSRYSWYLRLPGGAGHAWAGVVRCELPASLSAAEAASRADQVSASLPRFASLRHKEPRAPQNLFPIAGLERELRRRLGDPQLLYRAICRASDPKGSAR